MSQIYLPSLESLNIKNFSLYPNNGGLDFSYDFKNGLNLFVGGNGTGKTTLTKLIKFALIGHYREITDVSIYKEERKQKRPEYPKNFYRNRMQNTFEQNDMAEVTLNFKVNNVLFSVTRNLYDIKLTKASYIESGKSIVIEGEVIAQDKYEKLQPKEKQKYLQYNYEELVTKASALSSFDGIIFFVNEILYFGEDRQLVLWNWDIQEELSSKYFNDPKLDEERSTLLLEQKYKDTQARQTSEEIKAIRDAIDRVEKKDKDIIDPNQNPYYRINELRQRLEKEEKKIISIQKERVELTERRKQLNSSRIKNAQKLNEIESEVRIEEGKVHDLIWRNKNPKYEIYQKHLKNNHSCPACNQELSQPEFLKVYGTGDTCFVCHKLVKSSSKKSPEVTKLYKDIEGKQIEQQNTEREIVEIEQKLDDLDTTFNKLDLSLFNLKSQIRELDFELNQSQSKTTNSDPDASNEFKHKLELEIKDLQEKKKKYQEEGKSYSDKIAIISKEMNDKKAQILHELSQIFSKFAGNFLGVPCRLTNEDVVVDKGKKIRVYLPLVGNEEIPRTDPEEFSESQRFFVDLSFRMSLLSFFYKQPSFFICETPDSSLDISYERNAAEVFLEYMKQDNALIITSNLNNSDFLSYISTKAPAINHVNLLKIGRVSNIQSNSEILTQTSTKIEEIINGRKKI